MALSIVVVTAAMAYVGIIAHMSLDQHRKLLREETRREAYIAENMEEVNLFLAPYTTDHDIVPPMCPHCHKHSEYKMDSSGYKVCLTCGRSHDPLHHWGDRPEPMKCNMCGENEGWCDCDTAYAVLGG